MLGDRFPDLCQLRHGFIRNMLRLLGASIPITAVVEIAFNLMQDGVNPGRGRVRLVRLHDFMGGIPLARHGEVNSSEQVFVHDGQAESAGLFRGQCCLYGLSQLR
jgi:hypothetical protein